MKDTTFCKLHFGLILTFKNLNYTSLIDSWNRCIKYAVGVLLVVDQWGSVVVGIGCRNRHLPEMCIGIDTFRNRLLGIKVGFLTRVIGVLLVEKRKGGTNDAALALLYLLLLIWLFV